MRSTFRDVTASVNMNTTVMFKSEQSDMQNMEKKNSKSER